MTRIDAAPQTAARLSGFAAQRHGDRTAVRAKGDGVWEDRTYADVGEDIERLATGLMAHGIDAGDRASSPTRGPSGRSWPMRSGASAPSWSRSTPRTRPRSVRVVGTPARSPSSSRTPGSSPRSTPCACAAGPAGDLRRGGPRRLRRRRRARGGRRRAATATSSSGGGRPAPDDPALIIYTSGTTGPPKGCVLTHRNAMSVCSIVLELGTLLPGEVAYLYLPLAHVFAQIVQLAAYQVGAAIVLRGRHAADHRRAHGGASRLPAVGAARLREAPRAGDVTGPARAAGRPRPRGSSGRRCARSRPAASRSRTSWARSTGTRRDRVLEDPHALRRQPPRGLVRWRADRTRSSSSSTPPGSP